MQSALVSLFAIAALDSRLVGVEVAMFYPVILSNPRYFPRHFLLYFLRKRVLDYRIAEHTVHTLIGVLGQLLRIPFFRETVFA